MPTEIKLRAWIPDWDTMVNVELIDFKERWIAHENLRHDSMEDGDPVSQTDPYCVTPLDKCVLIQFTGLKDKNGLPIYEGDVVRLGWNSEVQPLWVEYQAPGFVMRFKTPSGAKSKSWSTFDVLHSENQFYEVIGNIWESPELLENAQQSSQEADER